MHVCDYCVQEYPRELVAVYLIGPDALEVQCKSCHDRREKACVELGIRKYAVSFASFVKRYDVSR